VEQDLAQPNRPEFEIARSRSGATVTVTLRGELDIATAPLLWESLTEVAVGAAETVLLDLSQLTFIDSSGLHALAAAYDALGERLRISASDACLRIATIAGLVDRLPFAGQTPSQTNTRAPSACQTSNPA
jgi:anti-sigma B factor antagonist